MAMETGVSEKALNRREKRQKKRDEMQGEEKKRDRKLRKGEWSREDKRGGGK